MIYARRWHNLILVYLWLRLSFGINVKGLPKGGGEEIRASDYGRSFYISLVRKDFEYEPNHWQKGLKGDEKWKDVKKKVCIELSNWLEYG